MREVRRKVHTEFWWRNLWERDHMEDLDMDGQHKIEMYIRLNDGSWIRFIWPKNRGQVAGYCDHNNETPTPPPPPPGPQKNKEELYWPKKK